MVPGGCGPGTLLPVFTCTRVCALASVRIHTKGPRALPPCLSVGCLSVGRVWWRVLPGGWGRSLPGLPGLRTAKNHPGSFEWGDIRRGCRPGPRPSGPGCFAGWYWLPGRPCLTTNPAAFLSPTWFVSPACADCNLWLCLA